MPEFGLYLVKPACKASIAALFKCSGVSKSGSPAPKPQTSMPSAFMALAFESMLSVREGVRIVARLASSMAGLVWFGFGLGNQRGAYLPYQLSIRGLRLFSL